MAAGAWGCNIHRRGAALRRGAAQIYVYGVSVGIHNHQYRHHMAAERGAVHDLRRSGIYYSGGFFGAS